MTMKHCHTRHLLKPLWLFILLVLSVVTAVAQRPALDKDTLEMEDVLLNQLPKKQVIGYYPNWRLYNRKGIAKPENLFYQKYTILNYSFFRPDAQGNIVSSDPISDHTLLEESPTVVEHAHLWGCRVMVSIGGWTFSDDFPAVAADPKKRHQFASECVRMLREYRFDGIDIDWEFPGYDGHKGGPADKVNFTLLMQDIRDSIDTYGKAINYKFLLTAAFGTYDDATMMIEWEKIVPILDYCNMMTYDFNGPWSADANHNSPLYAPAKGLEGSLDWVYHRMTERYHVPPEKLNLGVAFYGRSFLFPQKNAELYAVNTKLSDTVTWPVYEGTPQYFSIVEDMHMFNQYWDSTAQVPYLIKKDKTSLLSYDDPKSIHMKAEYVVDHNCAGVIIWEITGDYLETSPGSGKAGSTPLIDAINDVFKNPMRRRKIVRRG
jgi:chitinase